MRFGLVHNVQAEVLPVSRLIVELDIPTQTFETRRFQVLQECLAQLPRRLVVARSSYFRRIQSLGHISVAKRCSN